MLTVLFSSPIRKFIQEHQQDDPNELLLKYNAINDIPISFIVDQIVGRKKAKEKLPTWYGHDLIVYPPALNIEQASSEKAAFYKVSFLKRVLMQHLENKIVADLTGGFGVDSFAFSQSFKEVHFVEPNHKLLELARHNHQQLGATNISYYNDTAEQFLQSLPNIKKFDLLYIDPSRRNKADRKVFSFNQCEPDVVKLQDKILLLSNFLLVKASPLLDIDVGRKQLKHIKKICIVSIHNECKELLFYCEKKTKSEAVIDAINLNINNDEDRLEFTLSHESKAEVNYSNPLKYVYEPNASILKSGAFKTVASVFGIYKIHPNTHLYTSDNLIKSFPGRIFQVISTVKSDPKEIQHFFSERKANIITRNYPLTVNEIRKKVGLFEGGEKFLIACSGLEKKFLLVACKLNSR